MRGRKSKTSSDAREVCTGVRLSSVECYGLGCTACLLTYEKTGPAKIWQKYAWEMGTHTMALCTGALSAGAGHPTHRHPVMDGRASESGARMGPDHRPAGAQ